MKKYNLRKLMQKAWSLYRKASRKAASTFGDALKLAWAWIKVQAANAVKIEDAQNAAGLADTECRTWYGWKAEGREVMHTETAVFQVTVEDPTTKAGTRTESFFTFEQTFAPLLA